MKKNILFLTTLILFVFLNPALIFSEENGSGTRFSIVKKFTRASVPTRNFSAPTGKVLNSLEVMLSGGSSFGIEESDGMLGRIAIGLGGIAEIQLTRSSFMDNLTGRQKSFPTSVFKVALIPQQLASHWFVPNIALQLHSTPWRSTVDPNSQLQSEVKVDYNAMNLSSMNMENRFTTLYGIIGKDFGFFNVHGGITLTDVRVRNGYQWIYHEDLGHSVYQEIPDMQENLIAPFGSVSIAANKDTRLMAEIQAIPLIDYNIRSQQVEIKKTWQAIVGVRFFIMKWISLDTGVKYLSSAQGIADSEVNVGINFVLPFQQFFRQ